MPFVAPLNGSVRPTRTGSWQCSDAAALEGRRATRPLLHRRELPRQETSSRMPYEVSEGGSEVVSELKDAMSNPVLQRSAPSEFLMLRRVRHARPLTTALDRSGVIEVKRSAIDAESKKRRMWRSPLKRATPNPVLQRSAPSEVLHLEPVRRARPLNTALGPQR
jgi:hypothetical protein